MMIDIVNAPLASYCGCRLVDPRRLGFRNMDAGVFSNFGNQRLWLIAPVCVRTNDYYLFFVLHTKLLLIRAK
jgi:hypothetical protein